MIGLIPKDGRFFDLFEQSADIIVEATHEFRLLLSDLSKKQTASMRIKDLEHEADNVTHQTIEMLYKTFITPLDRDAIYKLITQMDNIIDLIEAASQRIFLYEITTVPKEALDLSDTCIRSAEHVRNAVSGLRNLKNSKKIIQECIEINRLENEADQFLRSAMAKLFREESDLRQLIKLKELYELLESCTDCCEDVANIIEGIVLEYA